MVSVDPFFVPTRSSLGKNISHKIVNFQNRQIVRTHPKINKISNPNSIQQIDMKKARFEVYKFAHSALHGEEKQKSNIQLAIKLGAKPPKKPYKNYKVLKEELQKELKEDKEKQKLYNIPVKHRISTHKSKLNKGTLRRKRKIGSGILNVYGKSTVCARIMEKLGQVDVDHTERKVVTISQDYFYRELTPAEKAKALKGQYNFDHPDAFNEELMLKTLQDILEGKKVTLPSYDYRTNSRSEIMETIYPADVVLFEGILVFYFPEIRNLFHMKLFVDTDSDTRLARRVPRDINERGRDLEQVLNQYMRFVKPAFEEFCLPTKKHADVIIPRGADNTVAIDLIVQHIRDFLNNRAEISKSLAHSSPSKRVNSGDAPYGLH